MSNGYIVLVLVYGSVDALVEDPRSIPCVTTAGAYVVNRLTDCRGGGNPCPHWKNSTPVNELVRTASSVLDLVEEPGTRSESRRAVYGTPICGFLGKI